MSAVRFALRKLRLEERSGLFSHLWGMRTCLGLFDAKALPWRPSGASWRPVRSFERFFRIAERTAAVFSVAESYVVSQKVIIYIYVFSPFEVTAFPQQQVSTTCLAINQVKQHWAWLVLGWVSLTFFASFIPTRAGHPSKVLTRPNVAWPDWLHGKWCLQGAMH